MSLIGNRLDQIVRCVSKLTQRHGDDIDTRSEAWSQRLSLPSTNDVGEKRKLRQKSEGLLLAPAYLAVHLGLNKLLVKEQASAACVCSIIYFISCSSPSKLGSIHSSQSLYLRLLATG